MCPPWQQGRKDLFPGSGKGLQQAKSSTTDWVGWGWVSNVIGPKVPHEGGACPVSTQQDPAVSGREISVGQQMGLGRDPLLSPALPGTP